MISALRHVFVDSWLGRILALLIFFAFIGWGVGDIFGNLGGSDANTVVKIGDRRITAEDLDRGIRSELPQVAKQMGVTDPSQLPPRPADKPPKLFCNAWSPKARFSPWRHVTACKCPTAWSARKYSPFLTFMERTENSTASCSTSAWRRRV